MMVLRHSLQGNQCIVMHGWTVNMHVQVYIYIFMIVLCTAVRTISQYTSLTFKVSKSHDALVAE